MPVEQRKICIRYYIGRAKYSSGLREINMLDIHGKQWSVSGAANNLFCNDLFFTLKLIFFLLSCQTIIILHKINFISFLTHLKLKAHLKVCQNVKLSQRINSKTLKLLYKRLIGVN